MKLGVLDIGTNSIHFVIFEIENDLTVAVRDRAKEITRLGDTSFQEGILSETAMHRALSAIRRFKKLAELGGVQKIKAVATSAVREAANGGDFIEMVERETGIKTNVITGKEEARLIYQAVKHSVSLADEQNLIVDIGGGSVEMIIGNAAGIVESGSLKLGTLRLVGEFLKKDPPLPKDIEQMRHQIRKGLKPWLQKIQNLQVKTMIGTSGTLMNMVVMANFLRNGNPIGMMNNFRIESQWLLELTKLLVGSDQKARARLKGIDPTRVDTMVPAAVLLEELLLGANFGELVLCDKAIREGIVYDYLARNRSKVELMNQFPDLRFRNVLQLAKKCDYEETHAHQVCRLALALFDQTQVLHQMGPAERELLRYAALLHDIGYHIHYKKHHKHSYYLIQHADLNGFEEREVEMVANISRYHCKALPKKSHENWAKLGKKDRKIVEHCAALLRVADGLDRSHFSVVREIACLLKQDRLVIQIATSSDPELEIWAANRKKDLLEKVFNRKVSLKTTKEKSQPVVALSPILPRTETVAEVKKYA